MAYVAEYTLSRTQILGAQFRVIFALMLRGARTRFFGNGLGFLVASVAWPLCHMLLLLAAYTVAGRIAPIGDSSLLFFATGLIPFMAFNYISRWTMLGVIYDRPLMAFPAVKVIDLVLARILLEVLGSFITAFALVFLLVFADVNPIPQDVVQASLAYVACVLLGVGMGIINSVIALAFRPWFTGYVLIIIGLYVSSGIIFYSDGLPHSVTYYLSFNPVFQAVEWMRSAYYPGYGSFDLDKNYLLWWAFCTISGGLVLERLIRGRVLMGQ